MTTSRIVLLAGAALLVAGTAALPALAQPGPRGGGGGFAMGEAFARADTNNDGRVSRDEGWAWLQARFAEVDANRDGGVTIEELRAYMDARRGNRPGPRPEARQQMEQRGAAMFRALDVNSDGKVTLEELRPFAEAMFRARDANSDGALSREEVSVRRDAGHHHRGPGMGPGMGPGGERRGAPPAAQPPATQPN
jgi:Ca2+-binding EF-hand superfamily protein